MVAMEIIDDWGEEEGRMLAMEIVVGGEGGEEAGRMLAMEVVGRGEEEG